MPANAPDVHEKLMAVLKRRGYIQPSYEIYGGVAGFYDYGPLGATFKKNLQDLWRSFYVVQEGMAEIECPTISPEQVFRASGHLEKFADTVIDCPACGTGNRGDHLVRGEWKRILDAATEAVAKHDAKGVADGLEDAVERVRDAAEKDPGPDSIRALLDGSHATFTDGRLHHAEAGGFTLTATGTTLSLVKGEKRLAALEVQCPGCQKPLDVANARIAAFNLMFKSSIGPGSGRAGYLRPETAQGMFMDFDWLYRFFREKLPFGAVQHGRAYRNEISPRQAMLRLREFNQMEAEVFFDPEAKTWPRFAALKDHELNLLRAETTEPVRMKMGDAVDQGIIANGALGYFIALTDVFLSAAGLSGDIVRYRQHEPTEKAHYSTDTWDAEFLSPRFGWVEIVGIADRTDYDLKAHERVSGVRLKALRRYPEPKEVEVNRIVPNPSKLGPLFKKQAGAVAAALKELHPDHVEEGAPLTVTVDGESITVNADCYRVERGTERVEGEPFTPHVVEPSYGIDRIVYAVLEANYVEKEWATLTLPSVLSPVKCGVFPLMSKDGLDDLAREVAAEFTAAGLIVQYDESGSIGKRYARQDEVGTPYCVTVDYDSKDDASVTVRARDTGEQKRVPRDGLAARLADLIAQRLSFADLPGTPVKSA